MTQTEKMLQQQFQELISSVETLRKRRMALQKVIDAEESKRAKFLDEIKKATEEAEKCDNKIRDLVTAKEKLDSTITQTETAFDKILQNTELLLAMTIKTGGELDEVM